MKFEMKRIVAAVAIAAVGATVAACGPDASERAQARMDNAADKTAAAVDRAGEKTAAAMDQAGDAMRDAGAKMEQKADELSKSAADAAITASIKTDLVKDPDLSALKIDVDTNAGVVTLNGTAPTQAAVDRAGRIAVAIAGVSEVRNHITVKQG